MGASEANVARRLCNFSLTWSTAAERSFMVLEKLNLLKVLYFTLNPGKSNTANVPFNSGLTFARVVNGSGK